MKFFLLSILLVVGALFGAWTVEHKEVDETTKSNEVSLPFQSETIEVYDGVRVSVNETELNLSGKGLTGSLKAEVRRVSNLEVLDISNNNFTGVPAEVGQLSKLRILNVSNNPVTGLPLEIGNLKNLEVLDLRGTNYAKQDVEQIRNTLPASTSILVD